jgi:hypothetical protein
MPWRKAISHKLSILQINQDLILGNISSNFGG